MLVTGGSGFVGSALCEALAAAGQHTIRAALRRAGPMPSGATESIVVGDVGTATDWNAALEGVEVVVHAAALAHEVSATEADAGAYLETNARGSRRLAESAAGAGVRRLLYLSTIKVNGETSAGGGFSPTATPRPQGAYATSKWRGEQSVVEIAAHSGLQVVIVRAPLVYGPGVRANFLRLLDWVDRGRPIPLGAVRNRRSLVGIWNLCDLLLRLLVDPQAPGRVWMVSDGDDRSTPELVQLIGRAMQRRVRLIRVPLPLLRVAATLAGRSADLSRVCDSLQADISETRRVLAWSPPVELEEGLQRTVSWYLGTRGRSAASRGA
ncbi:MAG: NAD-dependent epimerase/dehydratase family protein [Solirubrobacteraceae bacterium]